MSISYCKIASAIRDEAAVGDDSLHRGALQVRADSQRAGVGLFQLGDGGVDVERADVADDQPLDTGCLSDAANHCRRGMGWIEWSAGREVHVHDLHVRAFG